MRLFLNKKDSTRGFTMVELIVTLAVLSFGIIGVYNAFIPIATINYTISSRFTAAYLAQEGLEIVRNLRDDNFISQSVWSTGLVSCDLGCQADYKTGTAAQTIANQLKSYDDTNFLKVNADGFYSYDDGTDTPFKRKITITQESADVLKTDVVVTWNYNGQPHSIEAIGYLYNWY